MFFKILCFIHQFELTCTPTPFIMIRHALIGLLNIIKGSLFIDLYVGKLMNFSSWSFENIAKVLRTNRYVSGSERQCNYI
jgi:hypothetical protein